MTQEVKEQFCLSTAEDELNYFTGDEPSRVPGEFSMRVSLGHPGAMAQGVYRVIDGDVVRVEMRPR